MGPGTALADARSPRKIKKSSGRYNFLLDTLFVAVKALLSLCCLLNKA